MNATGISSGMAAPALPPELRRWNWGAFGLNWIWGIAHRSYFALFVFVPLFGLIVPFILGAKGNAWAWQNGDWNSVEEFEATQRRWSFYALIAYASAAVLCVVAFFAFDAALSHSELFAAASAAVQADRRVADRLGAPLEFGRVSGNISAMSGSGEADLTFPVTGPKAHGDVYVIAKKELGRWIMKQLIVQLPRGQYIDLNLADSSPQPLAAGFAPAAAPGIPQPVAAPVVTPRSVRVAGKADIHGEMPRTPLENVLARQVPGLTFCFSKAPPMPMQDVALKLVLDPRGSVQTTRLTKPELQGTPLERCVQQEVLRWQFPQPKGGGIAVITQPLSVTDAAR